MTALLNGQKRPNLNEQINRLDNILDGLAEGLNEAVVTAVSSGVREATAVVLRELLLNPELLARLVPVAPAPQPTFVERCSGMLRRWRLRIGAAVSTVAVVTVSLWRRSPDISRQALTKSKTVARRLLGQAARQTVAASIGTASAALSLWRARTTVVPATAIGVAVTFGSYMAGPSIAAAMCGLAAGCWTILYAQTTRAIGWVRGRQQIA